MTIEVKEPELEALIAERLKSGAFQDVEAMLLDALRVVSQKRCVDVRPKRSRAEAVAHIREIRKGVSLGGLKSKDLMDEGRA